MGFYDPQIDSQERGLQRGYDDLTQDFGRGKTRAQDDLLLALGQTDRSSGEALEDLGRSKDRNLAEILSARQRGDEDYGRAIQGLDRRYASLANEQGQAARRAGVESGGILAQSLAARQRNRALDQQPLDISRQRQQADLTTAEQELQDDYSRGVSRTGSEVDERKGALTLAFERLWGAGGDQEIGLSRAGRDLTAGKLDLSGSRWYQAAANGYVPTTPKRRRRVIY